MIRPDVSNSLIHLVRDSTDLTSESIFDKIISEKQINGSNISIRGKHECICFSETPISAIGQILAQNNNEFHYGPYGFMFTKKYLFDKGARPVIYQPNSDYELLPYELQYRHVKFEIGNIDWTWEREWRLKITRLELDPQKVTLIVPTRAKIDEYKQKFYKVRRALSMQSEGMLMSGELLSWHFISLEDLGY